MSLPLYFWLSDLEFQKLKAVFLLYTGQIPGKGANRAAYVSIVLQNCRKSDEELIKTLTGVRVDHLIKAIERLGGTPPQRISAHDVYSRELLRAYKALRNSQVRQ